MRVVLPEKMAEFFERYDVIVTPNFMSVSPPIEEDLNQTLSLLRSGGRDRQRVRTARDRVAVRVRQGPHAGELPDHGAAFEEGLLLDLGEAYQARTGYHKERPPLPA